MQEEELTQEQKAPKRKIKRRLTLLLNGLLVLVGVFLLVELSFLYFGGIIFRSAARKFVEQESLGVYSLYYENLRIEPITGYIHVRNFELSSDSARYDQLVKDGRIKTSLYDISLKELKFEGLSIRKLIFSDELLLESLKLYAPSFRILRIPENRPDDHKIEILKHDLYYLVNPYFNTVKIDRFDLEKGFFSLDTHKSRLMAKTGAEQISFNIKGFLINSDEYYKKENLFYSEEIDLRIYNYTLRLKDDIHEASVKRIIFSPHDSLMLLEDAQLKPIHESNNQRVYDMEVPMLKVSGIDVYNAWNNNELYLHSIFLYRPNIKVYEPLQVQKTNIIDENPEIARRSGSLYAMIDGLLKSLSFDDFVIDQAEFSLFKGKERVPSYDVSEFNMNLTGFLLDSVSHKRRNRIFFSEDIGLGFKRLKFKIINNSHFIEVDSLSASASQKQLLANGLRIYPRNDNFEGRQQVNITLKQLAFNSMDFLRAFNHGYLKMSELRVENPIIDIRQKKYGTSGRNVNTDLAYLLVSDFVHTFETNLILISDASVSLKQYLPHKKEAFYKGKFTMGLHSFLLNRQTALNTKSLFYAEHFDLGLYNFSMKAPTDLHSVKLDTLRISSRDSSVLLSRFSYTPQSAAQYPSVLKKYGRSLLSDIFIDRMTVSGFDLTNAVYEQHYDLNKVTLGSFNVFLRNYPQLKEKEEEEKQFYFQRLIPEDENQNPIEAEAEYSPSLKEKFSDSVYVAIDELLDENISFLKIKTIDITNGYIYFANTDTSRGVRNYTEGSISTKASDIRYVDSISGTNRLALSGLLDFSVRNLKHYNLDKNLNAKAGNFNYNSSDSSFRIEHFRLFPASETLIDSADAALYVYAPLVSLSSMGIDAFLTDNHLSAGAVDLPQLNVEIVFPKTKREEKQNEFKVFRLPEMIENLTVSNFDIDEGYFSMRRAGADSVFGKTKFSFHTEGISDDPKNYTFPLRYDKARLSLTDFSFQMPDSLNYVRSDSVYFSLDRNFLYANRLFYGLDSASVEKLVETPNTNTNNLLGIYTDELRINGLNILNLVFDRYININNIDITNSRAHITKIANGKNESNFSSVDFEKKLQEKLRQMFVRFKIGDLNIRNAEVNYTDRTKAKPDTFSLDRMFLRVTNFNAQRELPDGTLFLSDDIRFSVRHFNEDLSGGFYNLAFDEAGFSLKDKSLWVNNTHLKPLLGKYEFGIEMGYQKSRLDLSKADLRFSGIDFRALADRQNIRADSVILSNLQLKAFKDKHIPEDTLRRPPDFLKLLLSFDNVVDIREAEIKDADIIYEQNSEQYDKTGTISFRDMNATISNITNDTARIKDNKYMRARLSAKLQNEADMKVSFRFPLDTTENSVFVGLVDTFNLHSLNDFIENTILLSVEEGQSTKISFHVTLYDDHAEGRMHFFYNDLKISLLDTAAARRTFTSAIANVVLPSDNPKNRFSKLRDGTIYTKEVAYKNEFHLWAQAVLSGALSSISFESDEVKEHKKFKEKLKRVLDKEERRKARRIRKEKKRLENELDEEQSEDRPNK
jgi:hypothetical protein